MSIIAYFVIFIAAVQAMGEGSQYQPVRNHIAIKDAVNDPFFMFRPGAVRIIGGSTATRGMFPWHVAIIMDDTYFCNGAMISPSWVLTAAHCVDNFSVFKVIFGATEKVISSTESGVVMQITVKKTVHSGYSNSTYRNDIALLNLESAVSENKNISSIQIYRSAPALLNRTLLVSGWGVKNRDETAISSNLRYLKDGKAIENPQCAWTFGDAVTDSNFCFKSSEGIPCKFDDGAPVVISENGKYFLVGLVSFTDTKCQASTTVSTLIQSHLNWIKINSGV